MMHHLGEQGWLKEKPKIRRHGVLRGKISFFSLPSTAFTADMWFLGGFIEFNATAQIEAAAFGLERV